MYAGSRFNEESGWGLKGPRRRLRKRRTRRGTRGGRCTQGERVDTQQIPSAPTVSSFRPSAVKERGVGSRAAHFKKSFDKSVEKCVQCAQQIMDIRNRAESRASLGRIPLPARAKKGLELRQRRLERTSRHWGDSYAKATGETSAAGRLFWRNSLFQRSFTPGEPRASQQSVFEASSAVTTTVNTEVWGRVEETREDYTPVADIGWCSRCGNRGVVRVRRTCIPCIERADRGDYMRGSLHKKPRTGTRRRKR